MLTAILSGFALSFVAPWLQRVGRELAGWILALVPFGLFIYFVGFLAPVATGGVYTSAVAWVPSLGVDLSFSIDGLSLLFALLICGIGTLVVLYAGTYCAGHPRLGRFYTYILVFLASMLGLVLADNLLVLFVFWELTSVSSYLLIGFEQERAAARAAALQALLVTGAGGLALLAGLVLLGQIGGSWECSLLVSHGERIRAHPLYVPVLLLILAGAFTKSAQVPFHFWLPGAMEAPTPVSAYLHSATMVKAGVYLLARLQPVLGGTDAWHYLVTPVGAVTMLTGAILALLQNDLKRLLAYSTVSALGTLVLLLGLGTVLAAKAAVVFLLVHSLYKGALFLIAGVVDHEAGTREVERLGGLSGAMPITAVAVSLAALSMAGLPPLFGFISKELLYEAKLQAPQAAPLITGAGILANMVLVAVAGVVCVRPFFGRPRVTPRVPHEAPFSLWVGPLVLAGLGLLIGLFPDTIATPLVAPAVSAVRAEPTEIVLVLWHGINPIFALSVLTIGCGIGIYLGRDVLCRASGRFRFVTAWGPQRWYDAALAGLNGLAHAQTRFFQSGYLRVYVLTSALVVLVLTGNVFMNPAVLKGGAEWRETVSLAWIVAALILAAAWVAVRASSLLAAAVALGGVGYGIALVYILFGAPDLAMTQVAIETLTVVLFVLVLYRHPFEFVARSNLATRIRDALVALGVGGVITSIVLIGAAEPVGSRLTPYFAEHSLLSAKGRNVVNVILVDFRALDTLGEITVLAVAAVGVYTLLKFAHAK